MHVAEVRNPDSSSHISRTRSSSSKWFNKLRKGDHRLQSPNIDDSSDTMSDTSDFRWWTSILTRQCVTCLNLKYPLMLLQAARSMFLKMLREPLAMAINHPREMSLSCVVPTVQGDSRQELGRAGKDHHVLLPAVITAEKQFLNEKKVEILDWSFFYPDGLKMKCVEGQIRGGRRNKCPDFHV